MCDLHIFACAIISYKLYISFGQCDLCKWMFLLLSWPLISPNTLHLGPLWELVTSAEVEVDFDCKRAVCELQLRCCPEILEVAGLYFAQGRTSLNSTGKTLPANCVHREAKPQSWSSLRFYQLWLTKVARYLGRWGVNCPRKHVFPHWQFSTNAYKCNARTAE